VLGFASIGEVAICELLAPPVPPPPLTAPAFYRPFSNETPDVLSFSTESLDVLPFSTESSDSLSSSVDDQVQ
jgi:hypothetical protein